MAQGFTDPNLIIYVYNHLLYVQVTPHIDNGSSLVPTAGITGTDTEHSIDSQSLISSFPGMEEVGAGTSTTPENSLPWGLCSYRDWRQKGISNQFSILFFKLTVLETIDESFIIIAATTKLHIF